MNLGKNLNGSVDLNVSHIELKPLTVFPAIYENNENGLKYRAMGIADRRPKVSELPEKLVVYEDGEGKLYYRSPEDFDTKFTYYGTDTRPRQEVWSWAIDMENLLRFHDGKPGKTGWHEDSVESLFEHLKDEMRELTIEVTRYNAARRGGLTMGAPQMKTLVEQLQREALDLSNMAMMLAQQARAGY